MFQIRNKSLHSHSTFGNLSEAIIIGFMFVLFLWAIYLLVILFPNEAVQLGIQPSNWRGLIGVIFSPIIHSPSDIFHLINNSFPAFVLLVALIYFYREIALKVFTFSWIFSGLLVWLFASEPLSYHIGFSSVIYSLFSFLLISGIIRKYRPLQSLSLFVVFLYGSLVWGIFPSEERISWEGHLSGLVIGMSLAILYRKRGPQNPKYQFEIEKDLGIEPPDFEAEWNLTNQAEIDKQKIDSNSNQSTFIIYSYKKNDN